VTDVDITDIHIAVKAAGIIGFSGRYRELGGGEDNDTFVLHCETEDLILRISRYPEVKILHQEADALSALHLSGVPRLIYYDAENEIKGRSWILESYMQGREVESLSINQYRNLGSLLAEVHKVKIGKAEEPNYWQSFVKHHTLFGTERDFINHPDARLRRITSSAKAYLDDESKKQQRIEKSLVHNDLSTNNILVNGDSVYVIDWEYAKYRDPMSDFATIYYDDIEYNKGKWRVKIDSQRKAALFDGYLSMGGSIDEERIRAWMIVDKLGSSIYLYWRLYLSGRVDPAEQISQYKLDLGNLIGSLEKSLSLNVL
jgi:aminoglycoside phosphotransferase (APT) family kinase protein